MGNVSSWVLLVNTFLVGGFGVLSAWLATRSQSRGRLLDAKRSDAAIMRDKAGAIFEEIARVRKAGREAVLEAVVRSGKGPPGIASGTEGKAIMPNLEGLQPIVAVYFPNCLPILDAYDGELNARLNAIESSVGQGQGSVDEVARYKISINSVTREVQTATINRLRAALINEVHRFVPDNV